VIRPRARDQLAALLPAHNTRGCRDVTVADAVAVWGVTDSTARSFMHGITAARLAAQHPRKTGASKPYVWTMIKPPAAAS
jgi:hypothetical protein